MPDEVKQPESVTLYEYPKLVYLWPVIVLGFILWPLAAPRTVPDPSVKVEGQTVEAGGETGKVVEVRPMVRVAGDHEVLGWVYLVTLLVVVLTVGLDVERNAALFWLVAFVAIWLACWLLAEKNIPVFSHVYRFFADRDVSYDRGLGLVLSILLAFPFVGMWVLARLNNKWRITHNEFEHHSWGRMDDSLARGAKRVRTLYPDVLEFLLLGAGTLIVYSASGQTELRRLSNVPLLFLKRARIDRILGSVSVTTTEHEEEAAAGNEEQETL